MKTLSVGKKIMAGFLAVILMIAILLGLTVATSFSRNNDLEQVNAMSEMRRAANRMQQEFLLARVETRELFTKVDTEGVYNTAVEHMDAAIAQMEALKQQSAGLGNYLAAELAALEEQFAKVRADLDTVRQNDIQVSGAIDNMVASGQVMTGSGQTLYDLVLSLTLQIGAEDPATAVGRISAALVPAKQIGDTIEQARTDSRAVQLALDLEAIPSLMERLDAINEQGNALLGNLTTEEAKAAVNEVLAASVGFRTSLEEVETGMRNSEETIAHARTTFLELNDGVNAVVDTITEASNALNQNAITSSNQVLVIMVAVGLVAVVFSVGVALAMGRAITRPLNKMKAVMVQAGTTGNLNFTEEMKEDVLKEAQAKDEIGQSLRAFAAFIDHVTNMAAQLETVAGKDLTVEVKKLSEEDTMGNSLETMVDNLNHVFAEINAISSQVAVASNEIAMGAQSLAQGSTEQASTVEEISASVSEIDNQMTVSNETARESARQAEEINGIARDGNQKMTHLTSSMNEINEASQNIGQVIKVIDGIAFQTKILALNAAVEAARAGEHGKGFAVVADEVRNLAGKSADAAKETSELISANIEKTEQGMVFTQETAESLTRIMEGIAETNRTLQQVAEQSESVKSATGQVNQAVDQVAQVVQQNSATSEQSAASSQEMSSQAQVLRQLVAEFKLKGSMDNAMLPATEPAAEPIVFDSTATDDAALF